MTTDRPQSQDVDRWLTRIVSVEQLRQGDTFLMDGEAIPVAKDAYVDRRERRIVVWSDRTKFRFQRGQSVRKVLREIRDDQLEESRRRAVDKLVELHCLVETVEAGIVPDDALGMIRQRVEEVLDELAMPGDDPWRDKT